MMLVTCSKGHAYPITRTWCPECGELNKDYKRKPRRHVPPEERALPDERGQTAPLLFHDIPTSLKRRFKTACADAKTSMREQVMNFMDSYARASGH